MRTFYVWCCLLLLPLAGLAQASAEFQLKGVIGTPLESPRDVAANAHSFVYVLDNGHVTKLDEQGRFVAQLDPNSPDPAKAKLANILAISTDAAGNFYVADKGAREVRKFSPQGQQLLTFTHAKWTADPSISRDSYPENLTIDAAGNVYVVEPLRILKFNAQAQLQWIYDPIISRTESVVTLSAYKDIVTDVKGHVFILDGAYDVMTLSANTGELQQTFSIKAGSNNLQARYSLALDAAGNFYTLNGIAISKFNSAGVYQSILMPGFTTETNTLHFDEEGSLYVSTARVQTRYDHTGGAQLWKLNSAGQPVGQWGNQTGFTFLTQDKSGDFYVYDAIKRQLVKYASNGQKINRFPNTGTPGEFLGSDFVLGIVTDMSNNIYALQYDLKTTSLKKFNALGQYISKITIPSVTQGGPDYSTLGIGPLGEIYVTDSYSGIIYKLDQYGRPVLHFGSKGRGAGQFDTPKAIAVDARGFVYVTDINGHRLQKFSSTGQFIRESKNLTAIDDTYPRCYVGISVDAAGRVFIGSTLDAFVQVYDATGTLASRIPGTFSYPSINLQGTRLLALNHDRDAVHIFTATNPTGARKGLITGRIFQDLNYACAPKTAPALPNIAVIAEPGGYYGYSDENGNYSIAADTGTYTVRQLLPQEPGRTILQTCTTATTVHLAEYDSSVPGPDFGNQLSAMPYLSVSVASNRRRRCFRNTTTVAYSNTGFVAVADAKVMVELPQHVLFISANMPHTQDARGNYVFDVGTLQPNQHGTITILDSVACGDASIRGLTVCTKAWITPVNTYPPPPNWNEASITVAGTTQPGNQARFTIRNTGKGSTTDSLNLRVYQDAQLALIHRYSLPAADSLVLRIPATGQVVRVEADQPLGHPLKATASANVELPGRVTNGQPSAAMMAFPPDDAEPEKAEDCQPILDSYDPNDKHVLPAGLTAQHYTPTNTALRYQVRFQNTGNDVAYRVVVVDTLDAGLDISTLQVGAVSHPYHLSITGQARPVLTFTFDNILLPDSSHNLLGSNGFVQFSIQPRSGLAPKASIENFADIFFDYNEPVRTNTTLNRIFDVPPSVVPGLELAAKDVVVSPGISGFSPAQGRAGTLVTITGQHFAPSTTGNQVRFQGTAAQILQVTPTSLTVRVPAGATPGRIQVITPDGSAHSTASFTAFLPPTLTSLSAEEGIPGTILTLTGAHFSPVPDQDTVTIGGLAARVVLATSSRLDVEVPPGAPVGHILIKTLGGQAESLSLFKTWHPPTLTISSPGKGKAGSSVTLTGTNFSEVPTRNTVLFGATSGVVLQASATQLLVRVPTLAASGPIEVQTPGGKATTATEFTFIPAPVISSFSPAEGSAGTLVTIEGRNFLADGQTDTVYFEGVPAKLVSSSPTQIVAEVPTGARSGLLSVAGAGGPGLSATKFVVPVATAADAALSSALTLYPNPTAGQLTLDWQKANVAVQQMQIFDALGHLVLAHNLRQQTARTLTVTLAPNRPGLYLVVVYTAHGTITKRISLL
ncbi:conserved repeat domain-containing protein/Por secretion system C-terminal sorting domain-containing protein [Hymenobacter gelipurpurascens]|uniref:Conserved repeat domain-containing protein/Por secretion system C-terminal sorting domain-containing protein n=1 Tax=Hymenobacter gelipurpurascens TaxID=89968 RepID=A0A212T743_9BACT|nr:IPT/TIG domain-containing protein [Hymenobacter gelipurpurascens]SNC61671.1 conserved repeat domain-containing protein/Por secretion system C-terminal sorting domain-containing protein [Hymenobacter gelipurpurascens]